MEYQEPSEKNNPFFSIPQRKIDDAIEDIKNVHLNRSTGALSPIGSVLVDAIHRYAEANIPVDYWFLDMGDFKGDAVLKRKYDELVSDLPQAYKDGIRMCFAGSHGVGKSMVCASILKKAVEKRYSALYVNMVDVISISICHDSEKKEAARKILLASDFLVVDEFDQRFIGTDNAADLFGRILEPTLRARIQNRMPIFLCTNSPNVATAFKGPLEASIGSLMKMVKVVPVVGQDYRGGV